MCPAKQLATAYMASLQISFAYLIYGKSDDKGCPCLFDEAADTCKSEDKVHCESCHEQIFAAMHAMFATHHAVQCSKVTFS